MKNLYLLLFAIVSLPLFIFTSCNDDDDNDDGDVNTGIDSSDALPNTFLSNKVGSYWKYGSRGDTITHNYTRNATGKDSVKEGLPLSYYDRVDDSTGYHTAEYFGTFDNKLVTLIDADGTESTYIPYVFFVRGAKKGTTWKNSGTVSYFGVNANVTLESQLVDVNLKMSWGGWNFDSVYHVKTEMYAGAANTHAGTLNVWFNDGLGIIKGDASIDILGQFVRNYTDSLIDYHIEP